MHKKYYRRQTVGNLRETTVKPLHKGQVGIYQPMSTIQKMSIIRVFSQKFLFCHTIAEYYTLYHSDSYCLYGLKPHVAQKCFYLVMQVMQWEISPMREAV